MSKDEDGQSAATTNGAKANTGFAARLLSALVMVPIAIAVVYFGSWALVGFLCFVAAIMSFEWNRLTRQEGQLKSFYGLIFLHGATVALACYFGTVGNWSAAFMSVVAGIVIILLIMLPKKRSPLWPLLAIPYFALPAMALVWLRASSSLTIDRAGETSGLEVVVWILVLVWATDAGGYFAGKSIGGPKLAPRISPNKTWAGFIGGAVLAGLVGIITASVTDWQLAKDLVFLSLVFSVISQIGDLVESAIKRHFDVKDIGSFIPGHGGVMDRMDGLLFVLACAALVGIAQGGTMIG